MEVPLSSKNKTIQNSCPNINSRIVYVQDENKLDCLIGARLGTLRSLFKIPAAVFAKILGVTESEILQIEKGDKILSVAGLWLLCQCFYPLDIRCMFYNHLSDATYSCPETPTQRRRRKRLMKPYEE